MPPTPADRFARVIDGLCRAIAARGAGGGLAGALTLLLWGYLRRKAARLAGHAARIEAGAPPAASRARRRPASPRPPPPRSRPRLRQRLPEGFAWLVRVVPEAAGYGSQLQHLLSDPDMAALIAAAPQMRRHLRPLCRMLGIRPPPSLTSPPPARPASPADPLPPVRAAPEAAPLAPPLRPPRPAPVRAPRSGLRACGPPVPA